MKEFFSWILARAKEPSTWAGAAAIAASVGQPAVAAALGVVAGAMTEGKGNAG